MLMANAGYLPKREEMLTSDVDEWWRGYEAGTPLVAGQLEYWS